jgi:putative FmdB family regulatory protein
MVYEYKCGSCQEVFELEWKDRDTIPEYATCPKCGERSPRKFSSFSFSFSPYLRELRNGNMVDY